MIFVQRLLRKLSDLNCYNILNHLSYNSIQTTLGNAAFGSINGADPARVIQVALRLEL